MAMYVIHTDGSCIDKSGPGRGGYGVVVRLGEVVTKLSLGFVRTTNNRMELLAAITALEGLSDNRKVSLHTDSKYVIDGITKWVYGWRRKNWKTKIGEDVKNKDLWLRLYDLNKQHKVRWIWVKGHSGVPDNELADTLAKDAATNRAFEIDEGFVEAA